MLHDGLYEQVISKELDSELSSAAFAFSVMNNSEKIV